MYGVRSAADNNYGSAQSSVLEGEMKNWEEACPLESHLLFWQTHNHSFPFVLNENALQRTILRITRGLKPDCHRMAYSLALLGPPPPVSSVFISLFPASLKISFLIFPLPLTG